MTIKNTNTSKIKAWALVDSNNQVVVTANTRAQAREMKLGNERIVKLQFAKFAR